MKEAGSDIGTVFCFASKERPKLHLALNFEMIFFFKAGEDGQSLPDGSRNPRSFRKHNMLLIERTSGAAH